MKGLLVEPEAGKGMMLVSLHGTGTAIVIETHLIRNVVVEMSRVGWIAQVRLIWRLLHMDIWGDGS